MMTGNVISFSAPLLSLVSCWKTEPKKPAKSDKPINYKVDNVKPLDFNAIFNNANLKTTEPVFFGGINQTAYTQAVSFILNIVRGMGWNWEDRDKINKLYDPTFDFQDVDPEKATDHELGQNRIESIESKFEKKFSFNFYNDYDEGISQFIEKKASQPLVSRLYNQIKELVMIDKKSPHYRKIDCSTEVIIDLGVDFNSLKYGQKLTRIANRLNDKTVVSQVFQNKKYAYTWGGNVLTKLGFQVQTKAGRSRLLLYHISNSLPDIYKELAAIRAHNTKLEELLHKTPLTSSEQKNLEQVAIDPFGIAGTMPKRFLFTNTNLKHSANQASAAKYFAPSTGVYIKDGLYDWAKTGNDEKAQAVSSYNSFFDASDPGAVVLKMFGGRGMAKITESLAVKYPLKTITTPNRVQTFYVIKNEAKKRQMVELVFRFLKFFKNQINNRTNDVVSIEKIVSPVIKSFFGFIANTEFTKADVTTQFNKYNNGSHYMLGVEIFLRGMTSIPHHLLSNFQMPKGMRLYMSLKPRIKRKKTEIVGMDNVNMIFPILFITYTSSKELGSGVKNYYNFNPQTTAYNNKQIDYTEHFLADLSAQQKPGKEIKVFPL